MKGRKDRLNQQSSDENYFMYNEANVKRKPMKKKCKGAWTLSQNEIYLKFLKDHRQLFDTQFVRRSKKVFRRLSTALRRRNPEQCRSHHQKYEVKNSYDTDLIIKQLEQKVAELRKRKALKAEKALKAKKSKQAQENQQAQINVKLEQKEVVVKKQQKRTLDIEQNLQKNFIKIKDNACYQIYRNSQQNFEFNIKILNWQMDGC